MRGRSLSHSTNGDGDSLLLPSWNIRIRPLCDRYGCAGRPWTVGHKIAVFGLMDETEELSGVDGDGSSLFLRDFAAISALKASRLAGILDKSPSLCQPRAMQSRFKNSVLASPVRPPWIPHICCSLANECLPKLK